MRIFTLKLLFIALIYNIFLASTPAQSAPRKNTKLTTNMQNITILHDGRIKPLDSFARSTLKQISGTEKNAMPWLLEALFDPVRAENALVLKVKSNALAHTLDLPPRKGRRYSYKDITAALTKHKDLLLNTLSIEEDQLTQAQKNLLALEYNTALLGNVLSSLSLYLPLSINLPTDTAIFPADLEDKAVSYVEILPYQRMLEDHVKAIVAQKGMDPTTYTKSEQQLTLLSFMLANVRARGAQSDIFQIIPDMQGPGYHAPWDNVLGGKSYPASKPYTTAWKSLAQSYHTKNYESFNATAKNLQSDDRKIRLETLYNRLSPFKLSFALYLISLSTALCITVLKRARRSLIMIALSSLCLGFCIHAAGIGARMFILSRPPVGTLYESILFVGAVSVLYTLYAFVRTQKTLWIWLGALIGAVLHQLGFAHDQGGDSMMMLTAVLNTNFWLSTHVTVITAGYAFCIITALLGHISLFQLSSGRFESQKQLYKSANYIALIALLLTVVGTILGGIWADQSWGRFWGWDPKENGALLIVLWLAWIIHGRIAKIFFPIWVSAGYAFLSVVLALSWFGVNLLSVGLHAYGFTDSAAWSLTLFIGIETLIITALVALGIQKHGGLNAS
jgi:ABC-type transport system involved in cytochrome c biogenesis permease subunit